MVHRTATEMAALVAVFKSLPHLSRQVSGTLHSSRPQSFPRCSFWQDQFSLSIVLPGVDVSTVFEGCNVAAWPTRIRELISLE
jgi:hypothetical protein